MKVGCLGYDTSRGLGHLVRDFYLNSVITHVMVVEHPSIPSNRDWYPDAPRTQARNLNLKLAKEFCKSMDVMFFIETPFSWELIRFCNLEGIRTILLVMYECSPAHISHEPSVYLCPSLLDMQYFPLNKSVFLPLPVSNDLKWRLRESAEVFIHNGGYLGLRGREGTVTLIEAMQYVKSPLKLRIRVQENVSPQHQRMCAADKRIEYEAKTFPYEEMFSSGDVYIAPQKFNGCSLPLQEAFASGYCVMTTNRFPMNTWLPNDPMIPVQSYQRAKVGASYKEFQEAIVSRIEIAKTMDSWYQKPITHLSLQGRDFGILNSWNNLRSKYLEVLAGEKECASST